MFETTPSRSIQRLNSECTTVTPCRIPCFSWGPYSITHFSKLAKPQHFWLGSGKFSPGSNDQLLTSS